MKRLLVLCAVLVGVVWICGASSPAYAIYRAHVGSTVYDADSIPGLCGIPYTFAPPAWDYPNSHRVCKWRGFNGGQVCIFAPDDGPISCTAYLGWGGVLGTIEVVYPRAPSELCWDSELGTLYGDWRTAPSSGSCSMCPPPQVWNSTSHSCVAPDCAEGWEWDSDVSACRVSCLSDGTLYDYHSHSCVNQCPVGQYAPYAYHSNRLLEVDGESFTVNGCKVVAHSLCHKDTAIPPTYATGNVCEVLFAYSSTIPVTMISQAQYCQETGICGTGYTGDDHAPQLSGEHSELPAGSGATQIGTYDHAVGITEAHYVCLGGVARLAITVDGVLQEAIFQGQCPSLDTPVTENTGGVDSQYQQEIKDKVDAVATKQTSDSSVLSAVKDGVDAVKSGIEEIKMALGTPGGDDPPPAGGEFVPPGVPTVTTEHNGGIAGEVGTGDLGDSELAHFLNSLVPNLAPPTDACPSFTFPAIHPFTGEFVFTPKCEIWNVLGGMVIALAAFIAWCIVWRV